MELFCDEDTPCTDPARPFCDLTGEHAASEGIGKTCIPAPFAGTADAGLPDAMPPQCDGPETCDSIDNDCDDETDEDWSTELGQTCTAGVGACKNTGALECNSTGTGTGTACSAQPGTPAAEETCGNNIDDNCDGVADEGCACSPNETRDCGTDVGACSFGTQTCGADGTWGTECSGGTGPIAETCNGEDDNCNTVQDEGCYDVTVSTVGMGSVTSTPIGIDCGTDCTEVFMSGTLVSLTATPAANQVFTGWADGSCSGTGPCILTVVGATDITATFEAPKTLAITSIGNGSGTVASTPGGILCGSVCSTTFIHGSSIALVAAEDSQSSLVEWQGACTGSARTCVVDLQADTTVGAVFNKRGQHGWTKTFGDVADDRAYGVAFDLAGNIYATRANPGSIDLGGASTLPGTGPWLAKLNSQGQHVWSTRVNVR